jgi:hypothetical protein
MPVGLRSLLGGLGPAAAYCCGSQIEMKNSHFNLITAMSKKISLPSNADRVRLAVAFSLSAVNGFCADSSYATAVQSDGAVAYYRFSDSLIRSNIHVNSGSLAAAGNATNTYNVHAFPGALANDGDKSQFFDSATSYAMIPYNAALNPDNSKPFTIEAWFYPASDQINGGQCTLNNRLAGSAPDRTGWVFFQRSPNDTYEGKTGHEGIGWNCRMYRGSGSSSGLDVVSQVPYEIGKWTHVVVVYDPVDPVTDARLIIYINGVAANTNLWTGGSSGSDPGYVANAADSEVALSFGAYNNTSGAGGNAYFGGIDEFALYADKLTPDQILSHYQNGTNASRTQPYDALIRSANPVTYLRFNEMSPGQDQALNLGDLRAAGVGSNSTGVRHSSHSALAGRTDDGSFSGHWRNGGGTLADIPWAAENNPDAGVPFTFEAWFRPLNDRQDPGPSPVNNRLANGIPNRTGWVIYQRSPNDTYESSAVPGHSGVGWTFRMYTGTGSGGKDVLTGVPYNLGEWTHLVFTWEPQADLGMSDSGAEQWQGVLTAYVNGVLAASNPEAIYAANISPTEDGREPTDLAIGAYNKASGNGEEFEGDIDEVAFYNNYVLTTNQVLAHYQTGTNSHPATNYETLVLMAAYDSTSSQRTMPKTYLRFNDPSRFPAANSGSLGFVADGSLLQVTNNAAGPALVGFESPNPALLLDGTNAWVALSDPPGLELTGQITLEAWIRPAATQGAIARIISHGPPTATFYDLSTYTLTLSGSQLSSNEVFLRIEGNGASYSVGAFDGTNIHGVTAPVTAGDLGGANGWIHLVGTYDGANWRLYRNGAQLASAADSVGAVSVTAADWALGSTGNGWADGFAGAVDEVAIYDKALTTAQVASHYNAAQSVVVRLTIEKSGTTYLIKYPSGNLQQADAVNGQYNNVTGAVSPYPIPAGTTTKFYRLKL